MTAEPTTPTVREAIDIANESQSIYAEDPVGFTHKSCHTCEHVKVCKIFEVQAIHNEKVKKLTENSGIKLRLYPAEALATGCSEYIEVNGK